MSDNRSDSRQAQPSRTVSDRKNLTRTEAKYIDWNNNIEIRLNNLTPSISGQEGPGGPSSIPDIKSVFGVQPLQHVLPNSGNVRGIWKYYRPVSSPSYFESPSSSFSQHLTSEMLVCIFKLQIVLTNFYNMHTIST